MEDNSGFLTLLMNFVAPILLAVAIAYGIWRTGRKSWRERQETEAATRELYDR
jgi:hypothetical protein